MTLQEKVLEPELIDLPDWKVAELLNSPDISSNNGQLD